ncbi:hypothetical protein BC834DRAFT_641829 [Gloeopeniophorella convolvens]|nr:hypothetical protein BC834DRAFT_641829 [Gloeopeniophorella convolvens]
MQHRGDRAALNQMKCSLEQKVCTRTCTSCATTVDPLIICSRPPAGHMATAERQVCVSRAHNPVYGIDKRRVTAPPPLNALNTAAASRHVWSGDSTRSQPDRFSLSASMQGTFWHLLPLPQPTNFNLVLTTGSVKDRHQRCCLRLPGATCGDLLPQQDSEFEGPIAAHCGHALPLLRQSAYGPADTSNRPCTSAVSAPIHGSSMVAPRWLPCTMSGRCTGFSRYRC